MKTWRGRHVFSYGGNVRYNAFDLSLAPRGDSRTEAGGYAQDEIFLADRFRWVIGGAPRQVLEHRRRGVLAAHDVHVQAGAGAHGPRVVQPRLPRAVTRQQLPRHHDSQPARSRARSTQPLPAASTLPGRGGWQRGPREESLNAYEIGYSGVIANRATVSAAFYVNDTKNSIFFTQTGSYRATNPPPGWPLPPTVLELIVASGRFGPGNGLPSEFSYRNFGKVLQQGVELGVDMAITDTISADS